jgi:hypothetical protein
VSGGAFESNRRRTKATQPGERARETEFLDLPWEAIVTVAGLWLPRVIGPSRVIRPMPRIASAALLVIRFSGAKPVLPDCVVPVRVMPPNSRNGSVPARTGELKQCNFTSH